MKTPVKPRPDLPAVHLTPRQKQVLDLLVKRQTNAQIGESLGISLDGAKWHVSEIISILGVDSREEAADYWRVHNGLPARLRRLAASAFTGTAALRWAGAGGVVVVAVVAGLVWAALRTGDDATPADDATPSATEPATTTPGPTSTAAPSATAGTPAGDSRISPITIAAAVAPAPGTVMYTVTGCYQCDGPDVALVRHTTDGSGQTTSETVFGPGHPNANGQTPGMYDAAPDGTILAVAVCDQEYCGGVGPPPHNSLRRVFVSRDSGITWETVYEQTGGYVEIMHLWSAGTSRSGHETDAILIASSTSVTDANGRYVTSYVLLGGGARQDLQPPPGSGDYPMPFFVDAAGAVAWLSSDGMQVLDPAGTALFTLNDPDPGEMRMFAAARNADGTWRIGWTNRIGTTYHSRVGAFAADGTLLRAYEQTTDGFGQIAYAGPDLLLSNVGIGSGPTYHQVPAIVDTATGEATPIHLDFFDTTGGRNRFIALQTGPVLRVTGAGDCLNVRAEPDTAAESLGCYRDDVLLRDLGRTQDAGGMTWHAVATPDGREGWASGTYLE